MSAPRNPDQMWCILSTSSGRTLPLTRSLDAAGLEVWTPKRTIRRPAPGQRKRLVLGRRRKMIEVEVAILPGFVFARASQLDQIAAAAHDPASRHPSFTVFQLGGRVPLISDASITGLRAEEARAADLIQQARDADSIAEARLARAEFMRTERARRAAMRRERREFAEGQRVEVTDMPSMAGMVGVITQSNGTSAMIDFGGAFPMKVEAWRVIPHTLLGPDTESVAA